MCIFSLKYCAAVRELPLHPVIRLSRVIILELHAHLGTAELRLAKKTDFLLRAKYENVLVVDS